MNCDAYLVLERPLHLLVAHCQLCGEGNLREKEKVIIVSEKVKVIQMMFTWSTSPCFTNLAFGLSDQYTCTWEGKCDSIKS